MRKRIKNNPSADPQHMQHSQHMQQMQHPQHREDTLHQENTPIGKIPCIGKTRSPLQS